VLYARTEYSKKSRKKIFIFREQRMKKWVMIALLGLILGFVVGCVVSHPRIAPPPLKKEVRPVKPGPQHAWIPGHWKWAEGRSVWVPGYWQKIGPHYIWVPGHWK
jgi:hypothetical protein